MSKQPQEKDELLDHNYDGIQELNNPAPFWWQSLFYVCIAFGFAYMVYYIVLGGPSSTKEFEDQLALVTDAQQAKAKKDTPDEAKLVSFMKDPARVAHGQTVFASKCVSCHAPDGGGGIGPNLADNYWIHGKGQPLVVFEVVSKGVLDKRMPPWGGILTSDEMNDVVAYVKTLKGKPTAHPKAPQGDLVEN